MVGILAPSVEVTGELGTLCVSGKEVSMQSAAGFGSLVSKQGHYLHFVLRVLETQRGEGLFRFISLGLFRVSRSQESA